MCKLAGVGPSNALKAWQGKGEPGAGLNLRILTHTFSISLEQTSVLLKYVKYGREDRWAMELCVKTEAEFILENCSVRLRPWQNGSQVLVPAHMALQSPGHGNSPGSHTTHAECHQDGASPPRYCIHSLSHIATSILACHLPQETGHGQHDTTDRP